MICLSDAECCSGFICLRNGNEQKGFCSNGVQTLGGQETEFESGSANNTEAAGLRAFVRISVYFVNSLTWANKL